MMKFRLLIILMVLAFGANAQTYTNFGTQWQVKTGDTSSMRLVGSTPGNWKYFRTHAFNKTFFAPISPSGSGYIQLNPASPQSGNMNLNGNVTAVTSLLGDVSYRRIQGRSEIEGYIDGSKSALSIFGGAGYNPSTPFVSIYGEDNIGSDYDLLNVRNISSNIFRVNNNGNINIYTPITDTASNPSILTRAASGEVKVISGGLGGFVKKSGDTMTGDLILSSATPSNTLSAIPKTYVDNAVALKANIASPTFTGLVTTPRLTVSSTLSGVSASFMGRNNANSLDNSSYISVINDATVTSGANNRWTALALGGTIAGTSLGGASAAVASLTINASTAEGDLILATSAGAGLLERARILANGNFGIGISPTEKLHVAGNGLFTGTVTAPSFVGSLTGNATTATSLATTRTIWGQNFNGLGNIANAPLTGVTGISSSGNYVSSMVGANQVSVTSTGAPNNAQLRAVNDVGGLVLLVSQGSTSTGSVLGIPRAGNQMLLHTGTGNLAIGSSSAVDMILSTNDLERMRISSAGKVTVLATPTNPTDVVRKTELDLKADLASPAFTGNPTAPTQAAADNSTRLATTAYTTAAISALNLASGTYTPTSTLVLNATNITLQDGHYTRIGNQVTVTIGFLNLDATSGGFTLDVSLPIASNLAATNDVIGLATVTGSGSSAVNFKVVANTTNDRASIGGSTSGLSNQTGTITFTYTII